jgi:putative phosphoesterase
MRKIVVVGDTHISDFKDIPNNIIKYCENADWVIHVGDYITKNVLEGFQNLKKVHFKGVYGNADNLAVKNSLKPKEIIEISNIRIGIIHPHFGGSISYLERRILKSFMYYNVQIIIFGHTHDPAIFVKNGILLINPGKGYQDSNSLNPQATIALLEFGDHLKVKNVQIEY